MKSIAIVGAGITGRMMTFFATQEGWDVSLFDENVPNANTNCSHAAAGRLAPYCELEHAPKIMADLGLDSLPLWQQISEEIGSNLINKCGTLVVAHREHQSEMTRMENAIRSYTNAPIVKALNADELIEVEPEAHQFNNALHLPEECLIEPHQVLKTLYNHAKKAAKCHFSTKVDPNTLKKDFDWVVDCRGLGAEKELENLRGVRGEAFVLHAPDVALKTHLCLMHPRYPIYIVPRDNNHFYIGATLLETDDMSDMSVRSALELLSAAYTAHPGFAEARIVETVVHTRPAFNDNLPHIQKEEGILRLNGLYRHGYMVSPQLAQLACQAIKNEKISEQYQELLS